MMIILLLSHEMPHFTSHAANSVDSGSDIKKSDANYSIFFYIIATPLGNIL
jgi:hypothetical protein